MRQPTSIPEWAPDPLSNITSPQPDAEDVSQPVIHPALLQLVPPPPALDFEQLEYEVLAQRRIFIHSEPAIPVAGIIAVGGALLFHAALATIFILGYLYMPRAPIAGGGGGAGDPDFGGSHSPYMIDDPDTHVIPTAIAAAPPALAPPPSISTPPTPPALPPTPSVPSPPLQIVSAVPPPSPIDPIIGISGGHDPTPPILPPPPLPARPPLPRTPDTPPSVTGIPISAPPANPVLASPAVARGRPGPVRPGPDDGNDNGDEETIDLSANGSGSGTGSGKHRGPGIDRGASGANNETPAVLDAPAFKLWANYLFHPPAKRVILSVTVLPDGTAGDIAIAQSCGSKDVDLAYKTHVALHYRFRPAYREGRPFAATIQCSQSFGTDDE